MTSSAAALGGLSDKKPVIQKLYCVGLLENYKLQKIPQTLK